jgi:tryptophan 2,3-dioxygenase
MTAEEYREVAGFPGYTVSNLGNVRGPKGLLKPTPNNCGYLRVALSIKTKQTKRFVHRLVAEAFVVGDVTLQVNHKNTDRTNNESTNLEWLSGYENRQHAFTVGRVKGSMLEQEAALKMRAELYTTLLSDRALGLQFGATREQVRNARRYHRIPRIRLRGL